MAKCYQFKSITVDQSEKGAEKEEEEEEEDTCAERQLSFCRGVLPYAGIVLPNWVGDSNEAERNLSVPYFEIIAESQCHPRIQQFACAVLEPPCRGGVAVPPCRNFCRGNFQQDAADFTASEIVICC